MDTTTYVLKHTYHVDQPCQRVRMSGYTCLKRLRYSTSMIQILGTAEDPGTWLCVRARVRARARERESVCVYACVCVCVCMCGECSNKGLKNAT